MLVLTRCEQDRIIFPTLGISVEVLKLSRSRVSIGVVAPRGIRVIRHELMGPDETLCVDELPSSESLVLELREARDALLQGNADDALWGIEQLLQQVSLESIGSRPDESFANSAGGRATEETGAGKSQPNRNPPFRTGKFSSETVRESATEYQVSTPLDGHDEDQVTVRIRSSMPLDVVAPAIQANRRQTKIDRGMMVATVG